MRRFLALLLLPACLSVQAAEWKDSPELARLFRQEGITGTFIVHDLANDRYTVHDRKRGGGPTRRPEWAQDMSLRDAIRVSNLPVYQGLARRIGIERMRTGLRQLEYGNMDPGSVVDTFWLDGLLKISAYEQTVFLDKLVRDALPVPKATMAAVRAILRQEGSAELYAKTGWGVPPDGGDIGWWVGWVNKGGKLYTFALNLDIPDDAAGAKRVPLGKASLQALGLL
jgi:beta-lactamase class D